LFLGISHLKCKPMMMRTGPDEYKRFSRRQQSTFVGVTK